MSLFGKGGGLSINTDRNLLSSSSSSQAQPPAAPGLTPAQGSATTTAIGGAGAGARAGAGGGLFGSSSSAIATTSQPQPTGLFGTPLTAQPPQQQIGGLFGAAQPNNNNPQQLGSGTVGASGNMFGNSMNTGTTATTTAGGGGSGGLFGSMGGGGSSLNNNASQAKPLSLFGSALGAQGGGQQESRPAAAAAGGLFGGLGTQGNNASAPSLFGAQPSKPSLFGSGTNAPASGQQPSLFGLSGTTQNAAQPAQQPGLGGSLLGQRNTQQTIIPGVKIDVSQMRGTTRFNDLHEELQRKIEQADTFIQQQISYSGQCSALLPKHEQDLAYIPNDVDYVAHKLDTSELTIGNDSVAIARLKDLVREDTEDAQLSFKAIDNLKLPQHFHYSGLRLTGLAHSTRSAVDSATMDPTDDVPTSADFIAYFKKRAAAFAHTVAEYDRNVHEIEIHLRTVEASAIAQTEMIMARSAITSSSSLSSDTSSSSRNNGAAAVAAAAGDNGGRDDELRNLAAVLADFERGILSVASKVGAAKETVVELVVGSEDAFGNVLAPPASAPYGYTNNINNNNNNNNNNSSNNRRRGTAVR